MTRYVADKIHDEQNRNTKKSRSTERCVLADVYFSICDTVVSTRLFNKHVQVFIYLFIHEFTYLFLCSDGSRKSTGG